MEKKDSDKDSKLTPLEFAQAFTRPDLGSEYTRQLQKIYKDVKPLPFLRTPKLNIPWDDMVNNYLNHPDKINRGSVTFASRSKSTGIAYIIPLSARKKYQKFPKSGKPFNLSELEAQGIEVKTWNGEAWIKYGYDHINGLA